MTKTTRRLILLASAIALALPGFAIPPAAAVSTETPVPPVNACTELAATDISDIGGAGSKDIAATEIDNNGIAFCDVKGTMAPTIGFEILLPVATWTGRYLQVGCGGLCGNIRLDVGAADGCVPVTNGNFVIAATDMGHQGNDPSFGRDPQKRVDFAYRSVHLTALLSKKLIGTYYGRAETFSYFTGCSDGGREALMEAQRYPDDFDGIIAGAPAMLFQFQNSLHHAWLAISNTGPDGKAILTGSRLPILHKAVLAACDGLDGLEDGLLSDPRLCSFDPNSIVCADGTSDQSACLTQAEADVATMVYTGPVDAKTGVHLTLRDQQYGSELAWEGVFVPATADQPIFSTMIALSALQNLIFEQDPPNDYSLADLEFSAATVDLLKARHPLLDAVNPDLSAFKASGGKLILWHGWADPHISPLTTIAYHEALEATLGKAATDVFERLYLLPGVYHCGNGEGMAAIDLLTPMINWVEQGSAPDAVMSRTDTSVPTHFGQPPSGDKAPPAGAPPRKEAPAVIRSRPVYPYPALASYVGAGDPNDAGSYQRGEPLYTALTPSWIGADFFTPYTPAEK